MTEQEYIERIKPHLPKGETASSDALALIAEAVRLFPKCAELWFMHGVITNCAPDDDDCAGRAILASFQRCIELDPNFAAAYEELGHYFDGVRDNPEKAMEFYRKAAALRGESLV